MSSSGRSDRAELGRYDERFADHAVPVGRRTIFMATAESPDDRPSPSDE
ncbi:hypothetical protein [Nocardia sp. NPDC049707]